MKFKVCINPCGIVYNPHSICNSIRLLIEKKKFTEEDLMLYDGIWHSLQHHGRFSDPDKKMCLEKMNAEISSGAEFLRSAEFLFLTLGTAWFYKHKEKSIIVANCHKIPGAAFEKKLSDVEAIVSEFKTVFMDLKKINSKIKVVFTISPVRHLNDGIIENQLSKSILNVAIHKIVSELADCDYFPAYELQMDDLRDYRFYAADMAHPNEQAINYIREKFSETFIDEESNKIIAAVEKLHAAKNHRSYYPGSIADNEFKKSQLNKTKELMQKHPFLDLKCFEEYFLK